MCAESVFPLFAIWYEKRENKSETVRKERKEEEKGEGEKEKKEEEESNLTKVQG